MTMMIVVAAAIVVAGGLLIGAKPLQPRALWTVLLAPDGKIDSILVWTLRLPRSLAAFIGGAGLGVSGYLLQTLTRNPLAGPGLTGVTSGAVTPIVFCFVFVPWLSSVYYPLVGLAGGLAAALLTFWVSRGGRGRPLHLALGGISISLFLSAVTTYVLLLSGPQVPSLLFWLSGGFQGRSWTQLTYMTPWVLIGTAGALACQRVIGLLALSEQAAAGMGLQLSFWKPLVLLLAVFPVAGVTPVAGPIAFVGLAAPHIARLLRPNGPGWTIALTAALGGLMVVAADVIARSIAAPQELPVGIVTALIGGPLFIYLVQSRSFSLKGEA
ncbi:iron ABC transporter permease (plasmid) [Rhizobium sp. CB3171]|uniref:FecCD family ABC transporter permease n=1 Tax=Rhizobium sp. CB3171 TaxID=3039157 RepID=UPI0024B1A137|nr:iron ABC transporter permease [Rhizobium sp. CB3171]WFU04381.1 iron ABC transporter permease [Rhizobium sp. CB3171]